MISARRAMAGLALTLVALGITAWLVFVRKDECVAVGREIRFDDFGFSIESPSQRQPVFEQTHAGERRCVRLRVSNHARAVSYSMSNHVPVLLDSSGHEYQTSFEEIEWSESMSHLQPDLAPGTSCVQRLYFDVPRDTAGLRLRISWGKFGDVLDYVLIGDKSLAAE